MSKKNNQTTRFEVSLQDRLKQRNEANNAVRMPRLGFKQYCVYDLESEPRAMSPSPYTPAKQGQIVGRGTRVKALPGGASLKFGSSQTLNIVSSGTGMGKSTFSMSRLYGYVAQQWIVDELLRETPSNVQWLKPKHVTMLKLKGHKVVEL
jgi:hypothetical protein